MKREMPLQISDHVRTLGREAQAALGEQFARIDAIAEENTQKVLAAFQRHRVAESYFAGTTGYGYDDLGRDQLDAILRTFLGRKMLWSESALSTAHMPSLARFLAR